MSIYDEFTDEQWDEMEEFLERGGYDSIDGWCYDSDYRQVFRKHRGEPDDCPWTDDNGNEIEPWVQLWNAMEAYKAYEAYKEEES